LKNKIYDINIEIIDTPGLIPKGRISDLVCAECNLKIVPSWDIMEKEFKLKENKMILIDQLLWLRTVGNPEIKPIFSLYSSKNIDIHETTWEKGLEMFSKESPQSQNILKIPCD
jgi:ribosome biogenesis GTPase A